MTSSLNVLGKSLAYFGGTPIRSGFFRDGFCRTSPEDRGSHSVAAQVTTEFLDFSASRGNDLRTVGLADGCKWCLCAARWLEAYQAYEAGIIPKEAVPKVYLNATENTALRRIDLSVLQRFAINPDPDISSAGHTEL